jgi:hypothetical protein
MFWERLLMIEKYVSDIAIQMGMKLSKVSLVDGQPLGCLDVHLLNMSTKERIVSALIFKTDLENLENGISSDRLEVRMRAALSRLKVLLES